MALRKMARTTLHTGQRKKHRPKEQTFGHWKKARVG